MILSFHPCFVADENLICAGRDPAAGELAAILAATAVILPQGCRQSLFEMVTANCTHVFPNYRARFDFSGKIDQTRLFGKLRAHHPHTLIFASLADLYKREPSPTRHPPLDYPFVFKFDWGGEGDSVFRIDAPARFLELLVLAARFEQSGQRGFIIQEYVPSQNRSLRVVVIGRRYITYWRVQSDPQSFHTSLSRGAFIDKTSDPEIQKKGLAAVKKFCAATKINLAGFDLLFTKTDPGGGNPDPFFLEINYFFGRRALGGSQRFYDILNKEIKQWLTQIPG